MRLRGIWRVSDLVHEGRFIVAHSWILSCKTRDSTCGWTADITNTNLASALHTCAIYIGNTSVAPASKEGEPKCN